MSWRVDLRKDSRCGWADWQLADYKFPWALAQESMWGLPHKITFNDPSILVRYLVALDRQHAMPPEEIWVIYWENPDGTLKAEIEHPTWAELKEWLKK
jgi:hypothetical protein